MINVMVMLVDGKSTIVKLFSLLYNEYERECVKRRQRRIIEILGILFVEYFISSINE